MSVRRLDPIQPESFAFTPDNENWANEQIKKYPEGKQASAVIPLLWRAQEQHDGWLPEPAIRYVADKLDMSKIRVLEVATFYTMFNLSPVGKYFVQLCGTTPCMLRGSDDLKAVCEEFIGPQSTVTDDGLFSWLEVECLGACCNAPMVQINKYYYEDLTAENFRKLLQDLRDGKEVGTGPQINRQFSAPVNGQSTLLNITNKEVLPLEILQSYSSSGESSAQTDSESNETPKEVAGSDALGLVGSGATSESNNDIDGEAAKPQPLHEARNGKPDDLKQISGVGPKLEGTLNSLGVFHFDQIAAWTKENIDWVDDYLNFKGRIERDNWIEQAKTLATGGETDFSKRYQQSDEEDA